MKASKDLVGDLVDDPDQIVQTAEKHLKEYRQNSELVALKHQAITLYKIAAKKHHPIAIQRLSELGVKYVPRFSSLDSKSLSSSQKRLIFLQSLTSKSSLYNVPILLQIEGKVDVSLLEKSLKEILARHEVLRTLIKNINGELTPEVVSPDFFQIQRKLKPSSRSQIFHSVNQSLATEFDFSKNIPVKAELFYCNSGNYYLLLIINHIAIDGWSIDILLDELCEFYQQLKSKQELKAPPLPIQYSDYAKWQNNWLKDNPIAEKQLEYWLNKIKGYEDFLNLPTDKKRPPELSYLGETNRIPIPKDLENQINTLTNSSKISHAAFFMGAFSLFLHKICDQDDLVIGTPIANRNLSQAERVIGFFSNTIPIRSKVSANTQCIEHLQEIRQYLIDAQKNQDIPFEKIIEAHGVERQKNKHPLFQVMYSYQPFLRDKTIFLSDLILTQIDLYLPYAKYDLSLHVRQLGDEIELDFEFSSDLFDEYSQKSIPNLFIQFLRSLTCLPNHSLQELDLLSESEKKQLSIWQKAKSTSTEKSLIDAFTNAVSLYPDRIAIQHHKKTITYQQLDKKSSQLAYHLQKQGVVYKDFVGIHMDRSIEFIITVLAVLKAGGAYVPLALDNPEERLAHIISETDMRLILTKAPHPQLSPLTTKPILTYENIPFQKDDALGYVQQCREDNAYVIYTSGSTGRPKGVVISQQGVLRLVNGLTKLRLNEKDRIAHASNIAFDAATFEIWCSLLNGASLVIIPQEELLSPPILKKSLLEQKVTTMWMTSSLFNQSISQDPKLTESLRHLLVGGEALDTNTINEVIKNGKPQHLWNGYGPTESTTFTTIEEICHPVESGRSVPIGEPIGGTSVYLLDRFKNPVPIGVRGEIYIGGEGLAKGYINQEKLTKEKFIPNPFEPNCRLYRSGDYGRYLPDGRIEYLGRIDSQIKLRGYRIELEEIESVIKLIPQVRMAVVLMQKQGEGSLKLIAYIECFKVDSQAEMIEKCKEICSQHLPEYMRPYQYVILDKLPTLQSGKIDRRTLSTLEIHNQSLTEYIKPQTDNEKIIAAIWQSLLHHKQVGREDNFFYLGGDSILCIQLVTRCKQNGLLLSVKDIFDYPILSQLAKIAKPFQPKKGLAESEKKQQLSNWNHEKNSIQKKFDQIVKTYPLSPLQEGLWFRSIYEKDTDVYFVQSVLELTGELNKEVLKSAWESVVSAHDILRTGFIWSDVPRPMQYVKSAVQLPWFEKDWSLKRDQEIDHALKAFLEEDRHKGFDLSVAPLFRLHLIKASEKSHYLIWSQHHAIIDGWSTSLILRDLFHSYDAIEAGKPAAISIKNTYENYIQWLEAQNSQQAHQFWAKYLSPISEPTKLGMSSQCKSSGEYRREKRTLHHHETKSLLQIAQKRSITINSLLQAAWTLILSRFSHKTELTYGLTHSGRSIDLEGVENIVGVMINTLPFHIQVNQKSSLAKLLADIHKNLGQLSEYTYIPLVELQQRFPNSQFETLFVFENYPMTDQKSHTRKFYISKGHGIEQVEYPLTIVIVPGDELTVQFLYQEWIFDQTAISTIADAFQLLLQNFSKYLEQPIESIPILSHEKSQILIDLATKPEIKEYSKDLLDLFEEIVEKNGESIAVVDHARSITYQELNHLSTKLSYLLQKRGVEVDELVGIALERSSDFIIAMLAILKAGGAYVPLNVDDPKEKLGFIAKDTSIRFVITEEKIKQRLPLGPFEYIDVKLIENSPLKRIENRPGSLAYVMYTSGSTGIPKGVVIERSAIIRLNFGLDILKLSPQDRIAHSSNVAFDAATFEIWAALLNGARIVILSQSQLLSPSQLKEIFFSQKITTMWFSSSLFNQLIYQDQKLVKTLRHVLVGGEPLDPKTINEVLKNGKPQHLWNGYGPTENTTFTTLYEICEPIKIGASIPIGVPIRGTKVFIFDQCKQLVPQGVCGELYIGGQGLAKGYLNRDELTAEKFILSPIDRQTRLYKSGDFGRLLENGAIEFLGRVDSQVKIRGFRVEIGEIESVMNSHQSVDSVLIIASKDLKGQVTLITYVKPKFPISAPEDRAAIDLIKELKIKVSTLPAYMHPSSYVILNEFPLNANGKIDRTKLPKPGRLNHSSAKYEPPKTFIEKELCEIWKRLLKIEQIGIHDIFQELGGHSLLAARLVAQVKNRFSIDLELQTVFNQVTIAKLAQIIDKPLSHQETIKIEKSPSMGPYPLSHAQKRLWFYEKLAASQSLYHIPFVLELKGDLNERFLKQSFTKIIERHESLRTVFIESRGKVCQKILEPHPFASPIIFINTSKAKVADLCQQYLTQKFDLTKGPLIRAICYRLSPENYILQFVLHHIISDGWSMQIFCKELTDHYNSLCRKTFQKDLPPLKIQYTDFAAFQAQFLKSAAIKKQLTYWKHHLRDTPELWGLTDLIRPPQLTYRGQSVTKNFQAPTAQTIAQLSEKLECSRFVVWAGLIQGFLHAYTDQNLIVCGTTTANRHYPQIENLIGFFVNTIVIKSHLLSHSSFIDYLISLNEVILEAQANQDVPFDLLVSELGLERYSNKNPLFQVMLNYQKAEESELSFDGLTIENVLVEDSYARFDLSFTIVDSPQDPKVIFEFSKDLFKSETIANIPSLFEQFVESILQDPQRCISEIQWGNKTQELQSHFEHIDQAEESIASLFTKIAQKYPDSVAVEEQSSSLTYSQLDYKSSQLAHSLQQAGVIKGDFVGIYMERSIDFIVSILAILKAQAAYVPLALDYPEKRLDHIVSDTNIRLILTNSSQQKKLLSLKKPILIYENISLNQTAPLAKSCGEDPAYVIYTSGSTGKPKGVVIPQRGVVRLVYGLFMLKLSPKDRIAHFSNISFDAATFEIWCSLLQGAKLAIISQEELFSTFLLKKAFRSQDVTTCFITSSLFNHSVKQDPTLFKSLKHVLVGGEALDPNTINQVLKTGRPKHLWNAYGPTESTTFTTIEEIKEPIEKGHSVPIGRPIGGTSVYLLNQQKKQVPIGMKGEIYIGGQGLAKGYLNQDLLTKERFIPSPFEKEKILYRSGDYGRYLPDGRIEYLGRMDDQVKIRGYRIELQEIEKILCRVPTIDQVQVLLETSKANTPQIVAYIQGEISSAITDQCKSFCERFLPSYMHPQRYGFVPTWPLTPNGKVDRKALSSLAVFPEIPSQLIEPRNEMEKVLVEIWEKVLNTKGIRIQDNFFYKGGDSILSIQVVALAQQAGIQISVRTLFEYPTILALSAHLSQSEPKNLEIIGKEIDLQPFGLSPIQAWFFEQSMPKIDHFNQAQLIHLPQEISFKRLKEALFRLASHHDVFKLRFQKDALGNWTQSYQESNQDAIPMEVAHLESDQSMNKIADQAQSSLNIQKGPLAKAVFFTTPQVRSLLLVVHHLIIDGVSWRILTEDLMQLISSVQGELPEKTSSYQAWVQARLKMANQDAFVDKALSYWEKVSPSNPPIPQQASGLSKKAVMATQESRLSASLTDQLLKNSHQAYQTQINDLLLTALLKTLTFWLETDSITFTLEGHGREEISDQIDISRTLGWFTSIYPAHLQLVGNTLEEQIKAVKEQLRSIPNKGVDYGLLYHLTKKGRQVLPKSENAIAFNYLGQFHTSHKKDGVLGLGQEDLGLSIAPENLMPYNLSLNLVIVDGQLVSMCHYRADLIHDSSIERLMSSYLKNLEEVTLYCSKQTETKYTPSDFPLAKISQSQLDHVLEKKKQIIDLYPLSPLQEGLWFSSQYEPKSDLYFVQSVLELTDVRHDLFQKAWQDVINEREILRTGFYWKGLTSPLQYVLKTIDLPWQTVKVAPEKIDQRLQEILEKDRQNPFHLDEAPLLRFYWIEVEKGRAFFIWSQHHILFDGWSVSLILSDVLKSYEAYKNSQKPVLTYRPPYKRYIQWLQKQSVERAKEFWARHLSNFETPSQLQLVKKTQRLDKSPFYKTARLEIDLSESISRKIEDICKQNHVTVNAFWQAVWAIVLKQYSSSSKVVFGVTSSGRNIDLNGIETIVGMLINTVPIGVDIKDISAIELIKKMHRLMIDAIDYSYVSLSELIKEHPQANFETLLVFENHSHHLSSAHSQSIIKNTFAIEKAEYPLALIIGSSPTYKLQLPYKKDVYSYRQIQEIASSIKKIIHEITVDVKQTCNDFAIVTPKHLKQIAQFTEGKQQIRRGYLLHRFAHTSFGRAKIALSSQLESLSYQQLEKRSNQLAQYLLEIVKPKSRIAIYLERSIDYVVAMLAINKAGSAFVPIEPSTPLERAKEIIEKSSSCLLITNQEVFKKGQSSFDICHLQDAKHHIENMSAIEPQLTFTQNDEAYVIYTSGTTGTPKIISITHKGVANAIYSAKNLLSLNSAMILPILVSFGFDASILTIYSALAAKAELYICNYDEMVHFETIAKKINQSGKKGALIATPSIIKRYLTTLKEKVLDQSPDIALGGEAVDGSFLHELQSVSDRLYNMYGLTEVSILSTIDQIDPQKSPINTPPSIGQVIDNSAVYILNHEQQAVPRFVIGEIYLGGIGLAKNIVQNNKTSRPYIQSPFEKEDPLYGTGDYGYLDEKYKVVFCGRRDSLVKVHGYRIDLKEIDKAVQGVEFVQNSVTIKHKNHLVTFFTHKPRSQTQNKKEELIVKLRLTINKQLPSYMRPSQYYLVESIPLTINGKIDHLTLKEICQPETLVLPVNETELCLQAIFEQVLNSRPIGTNQSFFAIGGSSLDAIKAMSEMNIQLQSNITIPDIYNHPTIQELAQIIQSGSHVHNPMIQLKQAPGNTLLWLHPVSGLGTCYIPLANRLDFHGSVYIMNSPYFSDPSLSNSSMQELVKIYLNYIKPVLRGKITLCGWSLGGIIALEMSHQLEKQGIFVQKIVMLDSQNIHPYREQFVSQEYDHIEDIKLKKVLEMHHKLAIDYSPNPTCANVHILKTVKTNAKLPKQLRNDPYNGWKGVTESISSHSIPGTHETLLEEKYLPKLTKTIHTILES